MCTRDHCRQEKQMKKKKKVFRLGSQTLVKANNSKDRLDKQIGFSVKKQQRKKRQNKPFGSVKLTWSVKKI